MERRRRGKGGNKPGPTGPIAPFCLHAGREKDKKKGKKRGGKEKEEKEEEEEEERSFIIFPRFLAKNKGGGGERSEPLSTC